MLIGHRTTPPDAQEAVVQARLDYQAACDNMVAALNRDYIAAATETVVDRLTGPSDLVPPQFACPHCGERDPDSLILGEDLFEDHVHCTSCTMGYWLD